MVGTGSLQQRTCRGAEIGLDDEGGGAWPAGDVRLARLTLADATHYALSIENAALQGERLTNFLARLAPSGCPVPGSLIRAYSLPDAPFPSILLREHEDGHEGIGAAYLRFLDRARLAWLAALQETGPGLSPVLAWESGLARRFLAPAECAAALIGDGAALSGVADDYLGRGLLLLADPDISRSWPATMSLGGVTKVRKITGREFPVWVDLPAHQPALLASPLLDRVERLLAEA
jgi:hypothetical protein